MAYHGLISREPSDFEVGFLVDGQGIDLKTRIWVYKRNVYDHHGCAAWAFPSTDVEKAIAGFLKKPALTQKLEKRWFTIQFIACGYEVPDILTHLNDNVEKKYSVPDVIDTERISGDVYKMILGSFVDQFDVAMSPTSPLTSSHPGLLSPPTAPPLLPSPVARQNSRSSKRFWK
ncbi:hypothetical protein F5Y06DRAFT_293920 [Hypoxylon sp. FL0890]|nr:hypothetical protein F5Y06DRAFT_293920 [Hypoxylon sp. FL0890]